MRQFDVFENPSARSKTAVPSVVVLQSDFFSSTSAAVAAAPVPPVRHDLPERLYPVVSVRDRPFMIFVTDLATIPRSMLGAPVTNLDHERSRIIAALDLLFTGI